MRGSLRRRMRRRALDHARGDGHGISGRHLPTPVLCRGRSSLWSGARRRTPCRSRRGRLPRGISASRKRTCALIGTVRGERAKRADTLKFEDVSRRIIDSLKIEIEKVNWFSTYRVHHRVTKNFRKGRAFLLGDAAHIHSPAGGQGMNTGIGDAINLAWKLQTVLAGGAPDALLDSYEAERIAFAHRLVKTTDRVFTLATAEGKLADIIRTRLAPTIFPVQ